jgi:hypothetical protein
VRRTTLISGLIASGLTLTSLSAGVGAAQATDDRTLTGTTREVVREAPGGGTPERDTVLQTRDGLVPLTDSSRVPRNARVTVRATPADDEQMQVTRVVASSAEPADAPEQWQGMRDVYAAIVTPAGQKPNSNTVTQVDSLVTQASQYWSSQTRGQVSFGLVEAARYSSASSCEEVFDLWNEALEKFGQDENGDWKALGPGKHLVVVAPNNGPGCDYGFGTLGGLGVDQGANAVILSAPDKSLYAHELGHNLGLDHSNSVMCGKAQDGVWSNSAFAGCRAHDYDDLLDVMGYSGPTFGEGNLNLAHQDDFGIQSDVIRSITAHGTTSVKIAPLSSTSAAVRGVKVTDVNGQTYFLQYRTKSGRDAVAARNPLRPALGVEVLREDPDAYEGHGSYQLDATPTTIGDTDYRRSIPTGGTLVSGSRHIAFQVTSQTSTGATVRVVSSATPLIAVRPTITAPTKVKKKRTATIATRVYDSTSTRSPYAKVSLQIRNTRKQWVTLKTVTASVSGYARASTKVTRSAYYRWYLPGARKASAAKLVRAVR